ncbi:hypothetical protein ACP4OV_005042 [Aristida adscensionis]
MVSPRHQLLLLLSSAAAAASLVAVPAAAAEVAAAEGPSASLAWTWSSAAASSADDESCWGDPRECPVVYDVGGGGGSEGYEAWRRGRRRLQYSDYTDSAALPTPLLISYAALERDSVPCSVPGASYYNCQPGADANPYTRGCSAIAQCRD